MRRRLSIYFLGIVLFTLFMIAVVASIAIRTSVRHRNAENFSKLAGELSYNLDRLNRNGIDLARIIAENPLISDETSDRETLRFELLKFRKMLPLYEDISIVAPDGTVLVSTDFAGRGDWRHKRHFTEALEGRTAVSNVHLLTDPLTKVIQYTAPILSSDRVLAVVAVTMDMRQFAETVYHLRVGATGYAFVVDQSGTIILHPDNTRIFERGFPIEDRDLENGFYFNDKGTELYGNSHPSPGMPDHDDLNIPRWRVVVAQETGELFSPFWRALFFLSLLSAGIFLLSLILLSRLARRITQPLELLTRGIARIGEGHLDQRIEATGDEELRRLADAFNRMAAELRESRSLLIASERRYREMADMMPQALFETDMQGRYTYVNRAGLELFGRTEKDLSEGRMISDMLVPEDRQRVLQNAAAILKGAPTTGHEYSALRTDGRTFPVIVYSAPRYENDRVVGLRGLALDLTRIKEAEEELKRKDLQLMQAQKMESIGTLAGGLAHDFNNVLGGIGGAASLLTYLLEHDPGNATPEKMREYLDLIDSQVKRASEMIRQLLALSRGQEIVFAPMDLAHAVRQVVAISEKTFEKSVQFRVNIPDAPAPVNGDAALLEQVVLNILVNARHAMTIMRPPGSPQGGICSVTLERVAVEPGFPGWPHDLPTGVHWSLRISDSGVGIRPEDIGRIFDPFFSTKSAGTGSGLGLPMAYNILRRHHGHIAVSSVPGIGSIFTLFLPALETSGPPREKETAAPAAVRGNGVFLLADDEPAIRETTAEMLGMLGHTVVTARDGAEAVDIFRREAERIEYLVLDLLMPKLSGIEALREIRRLKPGIRALIISGYRFDERMQEAVSWGGLITLQKPFTVEQFTRAVTELTA